MTETTKTNKSTNHEPKMTNFSASFLLSEFRKDIRSLHAEFRNDFKTLDAKISTTNDKLATKIDTNFKWTLGIIFVMTFSILGIMFAKF
jgi:hypothetical protein